MAGIKRATIVQNLVNGVVIYHSSTVTRFKSVTIRNASTIAIPVYLNASGPTASPDFVVPPRKYETMPCDCTEIFFGYLPLIEAPAGLVYLYASDTELAASSGDILVATESGGAPIVQENGARLLLQRLTWIVGGVTQRAQVVTPAFPPRSLRAWAIAASAHMFAKSGVVTPLTFDANGLPTDASYIGTIRKGGDSTFHAPEGTTDLTFVHFGGNAAQVFREGLGANHYYPLADASSAAADLLSPIAGAYGAFNLLQQQPAIEPDGDYSTLFGFNVAGGHNLAKMTMPFKDVNGTGSFSLEFITKPTNGIGTFFDNSQGDLGVTPGGFKLTCGTGNASGVNLRLFMYMAAGPVFGEGGITQFTTTGQTHHVVLVVDTVNKQLGIYVDGVAVTIGGALNPANFGIYAAGMKNMLFGAEYNDANNGAYGNMQSLVTYPSALTSSQVAALYANATAPAPPEMLTAITDDLWPPFSGEIPT